MYRPMNMYNRKQDVKKPLCILNKLSIFLIILFCISTIFVALHDSVILKHNQSLGLTAFIQSAISNYIYFNREINVENFTVGLGGSTSTSGLGLGGLSTGFSPTSTFTASNISAGTSTNNLISQTVLDQYKLFDTYYQIVNTIINNYNPKVQQTISGIYNAVLPVINKLQSLDTVYQAYLNNPNTTTAKALSDNSTSLQNVINTLNPIILNFQNLIKTASFF